MHRRMRCLLQFLPIVAFIIFSCVHTPIKYTKFGPVLEDVDPMTTHLILHIRPDQEIKKSILEMVRDANTVFGNANIFILISEIQYDNPALNLDTSGKESVNSELFRSISDKEKSHRMHVFFVDEIITFDDNCLAGIYKGFHIDASPYKYLSWSTERSESEQSLAISKIPSSLFPLDEGLSTLGWRIILNLKPF